jgi:hypothetical protein
VSNAVKAKGKPFSLDRYRAEAKGEPFVLWLDDEHSIEIPRPTGDTIMDVEQASNSREIITLLCADKADEFLAAVGKEDAGVLKAVSIDMQEHFGIGGE